MVWNMNLEYLIIFVKGFPSIWDITDKEYNLRKKNRLAWDHICLCLKSDYNEMKDKDDFRKFVANEWRRLKGRWNRAHENFQTFSSLGFTRGFTNNTLLTKPFEYYELMTFLEKNYVNKVTQENKNEVPRIEEDSQNNETPTKRKSTSNNSTGAKRAYNNNNNKDRLLSDIEELLPFLKEIKKKVSDLEDDIKGLIRQTKRIVERQIDASNSSLENPGPSSKAKSLNSIYSESESSN